MSLPNSRTKPCTSATDVRINLIGTPCPDRLGQCLNKVRLPVTPPNKKGTHVKSSSNWCHTFCQLFLPLVFISISTWNIAASQLQWHFEAHSVEAKVNICLETSPSDPGMAGASKVMLQRLNDTGWYCWFKKSCVHQLRLVAYPIIYQLW